VGFWKTMGKVVFFPIYLPYRLSKNAAEKAKPYPIEAVVPTKNPDSYRYYFENLGHDTEMFGNHLIVFRKGISAKEKGEVMAKLQSKLATVI